MNRTELIQLIDTNIRKNENEEISGPVLNQVLKTILDHVPMKTESGLTVYDPAMSYSPGATCIHNGQLFLCYSNTTGAFNPGHWQLASAGLVVNTIAERDGLTSRFAGMVVTVDNGTEAVRYQLQTGTTNAHWRRIGDQDELEEMLIVQDYGQTQFQVPSNIKESRLLLNNLETKSYTINGDILTWSATNVPLEVDDQIILKYKLK